MAQSGECNVGTAAQSGQLDDTFLMKLSEQLGETLGSQLMQLGVYLRLDPSTVQKLRADSKDPLEIAFFLLKTWRDTRGKRKDSGAMFDELCLALSDLKKPDLTDHVRREQVRHLRDKLLKAKETTRSNRQKFNEQMKLVKDELRGTKADFESCRQKYDEDVRHLNEQVRLLKNEAAQETREQMKLVTKELRGVKLEVESCRQKCDEDVRQLNEQGRLLKDEAQQTRVQATSPKVLPSASSKKEVYERKERKRKLTKKARSDKPAKERALEVMRLLREYGEPQLWHEVSHHIVSRGQLDISDVITATNMPDLEFLLRSGEASDVTSLNLRDNDLFDDQDYVGRLCRGLEAMPQLESLVLTTTKLTDGGMRLFCRTVQSHCRRLTYFRCGGNPLTDAATAEVTATMRDLSGLKIYLNFCRLSPDACRRLDEDFPGRIYVLYQRR